jgi:hypothetical protein
MRPLFLHGARAVGFLESNRSAAGILIKGGLYELA